MAEVKLVVIYPRPKDIESFEEIYNTEHVPMAVEKLIGKTKIVTTKITALTSTGSRLLARSIGTRIRPCKD